VQLLSCIVVVFLVVKETHKLFFQNSVHKYFPLSAVRIFVSDFSNFDCHVSCLVWISLGLSCLGFTQFLEHVTSHLLSNLGSFCPLFFLVLFQYCSLLLLFQDFNDTNVSCFIIVSRVPAALFIFFNLLFSLLSTSDLSLSSWILFHSGVELFYYYYFSYCILFSSKFSIWFSLGLLFLCWDYFKNAGNSSLKPF